MIGLKEIRTIIESYNRSEILLGAIASHSALDVFDGAVEEMVPTLAICQEGREKTYTKYFKAERDAKGVLMTGVIDQTMVLKKFSDIILPDNQKVLRQKNVILVPNRSFSSYIHIDFIEKEFMIPIFGSRRLLRTEERDELRGYYWILEKAGLPYPEKVNNPKDINELVMVKLHHKVKRLERGFFSAASYKEYQEKAKVLMKQNVISKDDLKDARIERYIIGPVFNFNFFYSPLGDRDEPIELLGVDWRFETSLDGHVRLPAEQQMRLLKAQKDPEYVVCGHNSATVRESLLEKVFPLAEKFVKATKEHFPPGIIGPFCLQTCVDKDLNFYIYDVAPRIGGGTNIHMAVGHPYGNTLWRTNMSTGRRIAREIRRAVELDRLEKIVT
jgi:5-formaminoimidazole-4-carboxamide-1-(beta)-D-ribofuranosyl 5'-monophosphate synthetase